MTNPDRRMLLQGGLALTLASAVPAVADAAPQTVGQVSGQAFPVRVNVSNGRYVRHRPRVAVASYGVSYFYTGRTRTMSGSGGAMIDTALYGVTPEMMAEVSEAACLDLRERLAAAGETVAGVDETRDALAVANTPLREGNQNQGRGTFDGVTVAQRWLTVGSRTAPMVTGYSGEANSMLAGIGTRNRLAAASAALDAIVLTPVLWLDYARMRARRGVGVEGEVVVGVRAAPSGFIVSAADARGRLVMATLQVAEDVYAGRSYALDVASVTDPSSLRALMNVNASDARIVADPARWTPLALDAARGYNAGLTGAVRQIRAG